MATASEESKSLEGSQPSESNDRWIPLESNPEVFNSWASQAGLVTAQDQFVDIYGLDDDLLSIIPKPTKAVILLFPDNPAIKAKQGEHDDKIMKEGQYSIDETLFFVKQDISNACGTIALIHAIANSEVTYVPDSPLQNFIIECKNRTPEERSQFLSSTDLFTKIHLDSSALGQTQQPTSDEDGMNTDLHFSCFIAAPDGDVRRRAAETQIVPENAGSGSKTTEDKSTTEAAAVKLQLPAAGALARATLLGKAVAPPVIPAEGLLEGMRLIELDGRRPHPVDHGRCTDVLEDAIDVVKKLYLSQEESVYFSMMSLGPAPPQNSPFN